MLLFFPVLSFINAYSVDKNVMMETDVSITKDGVETYPTDVPDIEGFEIPEGVHERHETKFLATTLISITSQFTTGP